jgi:hypothetical protein
VLDEITNGEKAVGSNERQDLIGRDEKGNRINDSEEPENEKACQPIAVAIRQNALALFQLHSRNIVIR